MFPTMLIGVFSFTGGLQALGGPLAFLVRLIPFSHAILFMNGILLYNSPWTDLAVNVAYLVGTTIVFLVIGAKLFQREAILD